MYHFSQFEICCIVIKLCRRKLHDEHKTLIYILVLLRLFMIQFARSYLQLDSWPGLVLPDPSF